MNMSEDISTNGSVYFSTTVAGPAGTITALTCTTLAVTTVTATGGITSSGASTKLGYATGAGGTVTQATNKSTGVTLNKPVGQITLNNASLADNAEVTFTVTNSVVEANDVVIVNHSSVGTLGSYVVQAHTIAAGSFKISVGNVSGGSLGEAIVISFAVIKGAAS